jgi:hypothetical protein
MGEKQQIAIDRVKNEFDPKTLKGGVAKVIGKDVSETIAEFCRQDEEFARSVVDSDKSINECINSIAGSIHGQGCSDIDVYALAVKFYFPTATIHFNMTIDLAGDARSYAEKVGAVQSDTSKAGITVSKGGKKSKKINLSFDDLFGGI